MNDAPALKRADVGVAVQVRVCVWGGGALDEGLAGFGGVLWEKDWAEVLFCVFGGAGMPPRHAAQH